MHMKSTSRMTLNDRFSNLRQESSQKQIVEASRRYQRLAQQMENRPTVIAALKSLQVKKTAQYTVDTFFMNTNCLGLKE